MKEYKREKSLYESQVQDLSKRSQYHDDHLRIVDSWFTQVNTPPTSPHNTNLDADAADRIVTRRDQNSGWRPRLRPRTRGW